MAFLLLRRSQLGILRQNHSTFFFCVLFTSLLNSFPSVVRQFQREVRPPSRPEVIFWVSFLFYDPFPKTPPFSNAQVMRGARSSLFRREEDILPRPKVFPPPILLERSDVPFFPLFPFGMDMMRLHSSSVLTKWSGDVCWDPPPCPLFCPPPVQLFLFSTSHSTTAGKAYLGV